MSRLALGAAAALPWLLALGGKSVSWDDPAMTAGNPLLTLPWAQALPAFFGFHMTSFQPLGWLAYRALWTLGAGSPFPFHAAAVLLHAGNALLLASLLETLLPKAKPAARAFAVLVWAWHPVHAESVAWLSQLSDLMCGTFALAALLAHARERRGAALAWALCALLCRWKALAVPVFAFGLDAWKGRSVRETLRRNAGLVALALVTVGLNAAAKRSAGYAASLRLHECSVGLLVQLKKLVWPFGLAPTDLLDGGDNPYGWGLYAAVPALFFLAEGLYLLLRRRPPIGYAASSFVVLMLPTVLFAGAGPIAVMDHHLYLPSLAFVPLLASLPWNPFNAAVPVLLALLSLRQSAFWHDSETLWARVLSVHPMFPAARLNLAASRGGEGRYPQALVAIDEQLALFPSDDAARRLRAELVSLVAPDDASMARLQSDAASWLFEGGRAADAAARMDAALRLRPRDPELLVNAAIVDGALGRRALARERLTLALTLVPKHARAAEALRRLDAAEGR